MNGYFLEQPDNPTIIFKLKTLSLQKWCELCSCDLDALKAVVSNAIASVQKVIANQSNQ